MKPKVVGGTTGLSIFLSGITSAVALCCFAPWVVPLLGISGAIMFARLGHYRPYLIGVSTLLMVVAIVGAYRSRKACTIDCAADPAVRRRRFWLNLGLIVGVLVLLLAIFSSRLELFLQTHLSP